MDRVNQMKYGLNCFKYTMTQCSNYLKEIIQNTIGTSYANDSDNKPVLYKGRKISVSTPDGNCSNLVHVDYLHILITNFDDMFLTYKCSLFKHILHKIFKQIILINKWLNKMSVIAVENKDKVIEKLAELIEQSSNESIERSGLFLIGFSGGSLAGFLVTGLPKIKTDFSKWRIFFCDERVVPVNDPESTFGLYKRALIDSGAVSLKEDQFVQIKQGISAEEAATDYANQIKQFFPSAKLPQFDMLLLGMGPDGHTCSLFPGHKLLTETEKWIAPITDSPKPPPSRVTMTFPVVNNSRVCVFATAGKEKADMIKRVLVDKEDLPAARVKPHSGALYWIVDKDAAVYIKQ